MNKRILIALFSLGFLVFLLGCATAERCSRLFPAQEITKTVTVHDTIVSRDTLIKVFGDTISGFIPCPDPLPSVNGFKSNNLTVSIKPVKGGYVVDCSSAIKEYKFRLFDRIKTIVKDASANRTITVYKMNKVQFTFFWIGIALVLYLIVKTVLRIVSSFYPALNWVSFILRLLP